MVRNLFGYGVASGCGFKAVGVFIGSNGLDDGHFQLTASMFPASAATVRTAAVEGGDARAVTPLRFACFTTYVVASQRATR